MKRRDYLKLTLPSDVSYLSIGRMLVREAAGRLGFTEEDLFRIELGFEEAFMNVVKHAFEVDEAGHFDVICEQVPKGIRIILKEKGMPFDADRLPAFHPTTDLDSIGSRGLGTFLMREVLDEVSFYNLGSEGKETQLVKHLQSRSIHEQIDASEAEPFEEEGGPGAIRERLDYDVRRMMPAEAIEISRCAYKSHGYTFFDDAIYYPDQLVALNETGELISVVAATKENKFMGHAALHYSYRGSPIAELTFIFVNPEYRGQECMKRMLGKLFSLPETERLEGVYAFAVANHMFSQKTMCEYGLIDCGIELATSPATWTFKGIKGDESQRVSVVLSFRHLQDVTSLTLFPPSRHANMIERMHGKMGVAHRYVVPSEEQLLAEEKDSEIETRIYAVEGNAEIFVRRYGANVIKEIRTTVRHLCIQQVAAINLFLSLEDPLTYHMAAEFEKMDFFFSGILPKTQIGETLILQYLNNIAFDYDKVVVYTAFGKEILQYIRGCDPNAWA